MNNVSLVIPTRNNLKYVKFAYYSIRKHLGKEVEVVLLDDASTDGTLEWMQKLSALDSNLKIYRNKGPERVGHTILYDVGASMATNEIFGIFHADMVATPNYLKNMIKHLGPKKVVSATRIEPPLHPPGPEKYVQDFGLEPEEFKEELFLYFVERQEKTEEGRSTKGIFAPWITYVKDFQEIGGHDKRVFAPMELEDSDLFNRFLLNGYTLIQSRDAFVYHMTCRGSRFKDGVKIEREIPLGNGNVWKKPEDSAEYTELRKIKFREWWRKWHMDVLHDENMLPIVHSRYDIGFAIHNCNLQLMEYLEPWCDTLYMDLDYISYSSYIEKEQKISKFNIKNKILPISNEKTNDIVVEFDGRSFGQTQYDFIKKLSQIIKGSGEVGTMEYDIFKIHIKSLSTFEKNLIYSEDKWYLNKLL